ncbi:MAG: methyltransferase domain-containing protein [Planctomycetes bacterium]|nr:methyltransferase domain-containing protein [Planctomycetota bacterium]
MNQDRCQWPPLACSVRDCFAPLVRRERLFACERGHSYDVAKSGYVNLLQPNDRRSLAAGDSAEHVAARVRLHARGVDLAVLDALVELVRPHAARGVVEVGCGPGFALERVERDLGCSALGLDLSAHAIDVAAKRAPRAAWIVANADRRLPLLDASVGTVISITGPKHATEFRRVLADGGRLVLGVPASDDQAELRAAVLGRADATERVERVLASVADVFELVERRTVRVRPTFDAAGLADLLLATYRGGRTREAERARELVELDVTLAVELCVLAPRQASAGSQLARSRSS